jgi:hypothetical protein
MSVGVGGRNILQMGVPRALFEARPEDGMNFGCVPLRCYDVLPDGQGFVATQIVDRHDASPVTHIRLVLNWIEELKAKVPGTQ